MSKMREAFRKIYRHDFYDPPDVGFVRDVFKEGWQAAIAAVKEGGAQAFIEHHKGGDNLNWDQLNHQDTPLYKLPDNL